MTTERTPIRTKSPQHVETAVAATSATAAVGAVRDKKRGLEIAASQASDKYVVFHFFCFVFYY
jgi:hypothetical protein